MADASPYRLPRTVIPSRYELELAPDLEAARFTGREAVDVEVVEPVREIVLNAIELEVDDIVLEAPDGRTLAGTISFDEETERASIALDGEATPGPWVLRCAFRGELNDLLRGFYRSRFVDDDGVEHVIATTQCQATDARRVFPCWDEPDLKARFAVTLEVPAHLFAVSNGAELERSDLGNGRHRVRFAETMPMSTYLVAFVVGPLEATAPVDANGVPLRVVHAPGKGNLTKFPLEVGTFSLRWLTEYYGLPYPSDKVDLVALPDFAMGAMENLGCVTFREALLLADPAAVTTAELEHVADVIAHELAHMWFGDLVTMKWWNGIWLNEAFATFMETSVVNAFKPEWQMWVRFSLSRSAALDVDALVATRPIEYPVESPSDAEGMFDVLTYEKGASVLRMLEQYLGEDAFREGVRRYLRDHAYGNTETTDLFDSLEQATGQPVRRIMDGWIFQGGYPLVTADVDGDRLVLQQRRFLLDADARDDTRWAVPVRARALGGADWQMTTLLDGDRAELALGEAAGRPLVVNAGASGFYRVHYGPTLRARLVGPALAELSTAERYALADDSWAAVVAGQATLREHCDLVRAFADERELPVWQTVLGSLSELDRFADASTRPGLQTFVRGLVAPALLRLGWEPGNGEDDLTRELRGLFIRSLGVLGGDPDAAARARELHARARRDASSVEANVAAAALVVVASTGDERDYEQILEHFQRTPNPQERVRYLYALAELDSAELMERTCALTLTDTVKTQNAPFLLARCLRNRHHGALAWRFVRDHWDEINDRFPKSSIIRMLEGLPALSDPDVYADVDAFFQTHDLPQATKTLRQHLERQRVNVALRPRAAAELADLFTPA